MDYIIFRPTFDAKIHHYGTIRNCDNIHDAKRRMKANPLLRGTKFYLVREEDFMEVMC